MWKQLVRLLAGSKLWNLCWAFSILGFLDNDSDFRYAEYSLSDTNLAFSQKYYQKYSRNASANQQQIYAFFMMQPLPSPTFESTVIDNGRDKFDIKISVIVIKLIIKSQIKFIFMYHSRISVIQGHTKDTKTDELYEPLRKTFLEDTTAKKTYLDDVSRVSHLTHYTRIHNNIENHDLGERTIILEDAKLIPTHEVWRVNKDTQYCIINAQEKQLAPISEEELKKRIEGKHEQVIVYSYGEEEKEQEILPTKLNSNPEPTKLNSKPYQPQPRKPSGLKVVSNKYNLFSMIDEPINNLISGKSCTCPANELVASNRNEVLWNVDEVNKNSA